MISQQRDNTLTIRRHPVAVSMVNTSRHIGNEVPVRGIVPIIYLRPDGRKFREAVERTLDGVVYICLELEMPDGSWQVVKGTTIFS